MQRSNSLMAVFDAVLSGGEVSRADVSRMTGFSLMTVGKVLDKLISCGIVGEVKTVGGGVGRKSGICALNKKHGIIIFDLTAIPRVRALDISNNIIAEYEGDDIPELMIKAMGALGDAGCTEIIGTAAIVTGKSEKIADSLENLFGFVPEVIVESARAAAYANAKRFDYSGMAMFLRFGGGSCDGAIMLGDALYLGANGNAGSFTTLGISAENIAQKLVDIAAIADPELIHISCGNDADCVKIESEIKKCEALKERFATKVIAEPFDACQSALDGAAMMLCEKYVYSKMPNNT